jgi:hypothetical protein
MEDWIIGVTFALFIIIPCWLALARRSKTIKQVDAWSELTQRIGLIYTPAKNLYPPSVHGEYRGRSLSINLFIYGDRDNTFALIYQNTSIALEVENHSGLSLSIQARRDRVRKSNNMEFSSGSQNFNRLFSVTGSPSEFIQRAVDLVVQSDPRLFAWLIRSLPSIELKGERLVCDQNSELTNVDDQNDLLDLLCDLADLAEKMEYESATTDARRK